MLRGWTYKLTAERAEDTVKPQVRPPELKLRSRVEVMVTRKPILSTSSPIKLQLDARPGQVGSEAGALKRRQGVNKMGRRLWRVILGYLQAIILPKLPLRPFLLGVNYG